VDRLKITFFGSMLNFFLPIVSGCDFGFLKKKKKLPEKLL